MGAKYTIDGNAAGAVRAVGDLNKALDKTDGAAQKTTKSAKQLAAEAQRIKEAVDPQEKYNRKLKELAEHVKAGRISFDQAKGAATRFRGELEKVGQAGDRAVGPQFANHVARAVTALGGMAGAAAFVSAAFNTMERSAQEAADAVFQSLGSIGELQQLGPEGFQKGIGIARQLVRSGAVAPNNRSQAADIASDLINSGFDDDQIQFIVNDLAASKLVKAENLSGIGGSLAKLQRTFGEKDLRDMTGRVLEAAGRTGANLAQTATEVLKFANLSSASGANLDETLAAFVAVENQAASPSAAAENLKSYFSQIYRRQLAGGDLQGTISAVEGKIGKGTAFDILGDANAVQAFDVLRGNIRGVTGLESAIGRARFNPGNLLATEPQMGAANVASIEGGRRAEAAYEIETERENLFQAVRSAQERRDIIRGTNGISRYVFEKLDNLTDRLGFEEGALRGAYRQRNEPDFMDQATISALEKYFARTAEASERTAKAVESLEGKRKSRATTREE